MDVSVNPFISCVIVNWNTKEVLLNCLRSINASLKPGSFEIIVIDNASEDGSADAVEKEFAGVRLTRNSDNRGFAYGVNQGLRAGVGTHFLVLNPDIELKPGTMEKLLDSFSEPKVGMVSPLLVNSDGSRQQGYIRKTPNLMQLLLFHTFIASWTEGKSRLREKYMEDSGTSADGFIKVDQLAGACMLVSRQVIEEVGMMDENFRLFYEDVDWCYRCRMKGWRIILRTDCECFHLGGKSFERQDNYWMHARFIMSMLYYFDKHSGWAVRVFSKIVCVSNSVLIVSGKTLYAVVASSGKKNAIRNSIKKHKYFLHEFADRYLMKGVPNT
jgi:hypothetical protein